MFLDPAKLLIIAVVALLVLGPEKLPKAAATLGTLRRDLHALRARVDGALGDVLSGAPSAAEVAAAVRSPLTLLDRLAGSPGSEGHATSASQQATAPPPGGEQSATGADPWDGWPASGHRGVPEASTADPAAVAPLN